MNTGSILFSGSYVFQVTADDNDGSFLNNNIRYSINSTSFIIDSLNGSIFTKQILMVNIK